MTEDAARELAVSLLSDLYQEVRAGAWVLTGSEEFDSAWAFFYNTREYHETQEERHALAGNGPLIVPKSGAAPWFAWPGADTASQVAKGRAAN